MDEKIVVVYEFKQRESTIHRQSLEEGSSDISCEIGGKTYTLGFAPAVDPETGVETCYPTIDGEQIYVNRPIMLQGEAILPEDRHPIKKKKMFEGLSVKAKLIMPALNTRTHPEGKTCGECVLWSREAGVEELEKVTHVFQNGEGQMVKEICQAMSCLHGKPLLTAKNVGYCPKLQELNASETPACKEFQSKSTPAVEG